MKFALQLGAGLRIEYAGDHPERKKRIVGKGVGGGVRPPQIKRLLAGNEPLLESPLGVEGGFFGWGD